MTPSGDRVEVGQHKSDPVDDSVEMGFILIPMEVLAYTVLVMTHSMILRFVATEFI